MVAVRPTSIAETTPFDRVATATGLTTATIGEPFGPYVVYEKLGEGGMASVHRAELVGDNGLRKPVALKRMHTQCAEDPEFVAAFVHEAQLAAKLRHPNIAQAYDLGKLDATYYIAMELVPGPTLAQVMNVVNQGAGAIPLPIALDILIQLCDALDHAHDLRDDAGKPLGLVHRDVSPMNVIISKTGNAKLIDFGIAKVRSAREVTQAGILKGKHAYIAPEYTYGQLDHRADLFALGVVAHEMLTCRRLFAVESDYETLRNVRVMPIPPPSRFVPGLSPQLDAIVLKALERDPDQRWQTAGDMRAALIAEVRRLGAQISGKQIRDWSEWAFKQTPRRNSSVDRMLEGLEPSLSVSMSMSIEDECPPVRRAPTEPTPAPAPAAPRAPTQIGIGTPAPRRATSTTSAARRAAGTTAAPPRATATTPPRRATGTTPPRRATGTTPPPRASTAEPTAVASAVVTAIDPASVASQVVTAVGPASVASAVVTAIDADAIASEVITAIGPADVASEMITAAVPRALSPMSLAIPSEAAAALAPHVTPAQRAAIPAAPATPEMMAMSPRAPSPPAQRAAISAARAVATPATAAAVSRRAPSPVALHAASIAMQAAPSAPMLAAGSAGTAAPSAAMLATGSAGTAVAAAPVAARAMPARRRAPAWRAPTRWAHPPKRRSAAPLVLLALIAIAAVLVSTGVIDLDAWREILTTYVG